MQARTDKATVPYTIQPGNTAERGTNRMSGGRQVTVKHSEISKFHDCIFELADLTVQQTAVPCRALPCFVGAVEVGVRAESGGSLGGSRSLLQLLGVKLWVFGGRPGWAARS